MNIMMIPAREILPGDSIDLGGVPVTVTKSESHPSVAAVWYLYLALPDPQGSDYVCSYMHGINPDTLVTVQRPEPVDPPDAALVEAMAEAIYHENDAYSTKWERTPTSTRDFYRSSARAALAAARKAGLR